jgi:hypothetical protein
MRVQEVRDIARAWVQEQFADHPEFVGAHLMGALNDMPPEAEFPSFSDVDMNIVIEGEGQRWPDESLHQGLMLEYGMKSVEAYRDPKAVIANPGLGPNLLTNSILLDPHGILTEAHTFVASEYGQQRWVRARCENEKRQRIEPYFPAIGASETSPLERLTALWFATLHLAGYVALAHLERPTHRRALEVAKHILKQQQGIDLYPALLDMFGCTAWDQRRVEACLSDAAAAFDLAITIHRSPHMGDFKLKAHLRPYFVDASQDMIARGFYREAVPWVMLYYELAALTINLDGSDEDRERFIAEGLMTTLGDLGLATAQDWATRADQCRQTAERMYEFCEAALATYPD